MAKYDEKREPTIDDVIKELGLEEIHYDGDELVDDPDKDFNDPYEETYEKLKEAQKKTRPEKSGYSSENHEFSVDLDMDAVNEVYNDNMQKKAKNSIGSLLNKILAVGGIAIVVLAVVFILGATGVVGHKNDEAETQTTAKDSKDSKSTDSKSKDSKSEDKKSDDSKDDKSTNKDSKDKASKDSDDKSKDDQKVVVIK